MKNIFVLSSWVILLTLCIGFSSCSDGDDEGNNTSSIIGKWKPIDIKDVGGCIESDPISPNDWIEFKQNGSFDSQDGSGQWTIKGDILTLTINSFPIPITQTIKSLTKDELIVVLTVPCGSSNSTSTTIYKKTN